MTKQKTKRSCSVISSVFLLLALMIFIFSFIPHKAYAVCGAPSTDDSQCGNANPCTFPKYNDDCTLIPIGSPCEWNPFCPKYTGYQCVTNNPPFSAGTYCQGTITGTGEDPQHRCGSMGIYFGNIKACVPDPPPPPPCVETGPHSCSACVLNSGSTNTCSNNGTRTCIMDCPAPQHTITQTCDVDLCPDKLCISDICSENAVCGATHNGCAVGTTGTTDSTDPNLWKWQCNGTGNGTTANCTEPKLTPINGVCAPNHYNCTAGNPTNPGYSSPYWTWQCDGSNGGSTTTCSELNPCPATDCPTCTSITTANCGWKNGSVCIQGTASCPDGVTSWQWTKSDCDNSINVCAGIPINGTCNNGPTHWGCGTGTLGTISDDATRYIWMCVGSGTGHTDTQCIEPKTSIPCRVTTSPPSCNLAVGETCAVSATVTDLPAGRTIASMLFGAYDTNKATVSLISDPTSLYSTTATCVAQGNTAVWATARLDNGDEVACQATGTTDTDINCSVTPPTPTPTLPAGPTPTPGVCGYTATKVEQCNAQGSAWTDVTALYPNFCVSPSSCSPIKDPLTCVLPTSTPTPTPPSSTYSISGLVFNDNNSDGTLNTGDTLYQGAVSFNILPFITFPDPFPQPGHYSFSNLSAGQYAIVFSGLPVGYGFTYPPSSTLPPNNILVRVGAGCDPMGAFSKGASCFGGNILNLNAGVSNTADAWIQSTGGDQRWDSGFNYPLPAGAHASLAGTGGMPGILFSGNSTPILGSGLASSTNWTVGTALYPEKFTDTHSAIPTSYEFLLATAQGSGIIPTTIPTTIDSSITHGIYKTKGTDLTINSPITFGSGNFIILVEGNLNINANIVVPVGSTVIFSAKNNITVNRTVGQAAATICNPTTHAGCNIEGLYSADNNFIVDGQNNCTIGSDLKLNIAGTVIANAGRVGATFINNRTLCANNATYPSVSFIERPDFLLNYPSMVSQNTRSWQDIAP